ncbi:SDR family NAD(P)-dependent oxidoreductase [Streptomyces shenzhenensis]|uniref:Oxidoreductase n=1 Tax=Streptomyces shenzhenensis TaxID=943815 RepID=A0A3M0I107_9ACTN|nr:SDR family NAD(P)-dependent oxidoreductase [Streptomyces shenzhenensis]RMB82118.1 oxidoreductase [Streptomyces shenzhenensis]
MSTSDTPATASDAAEDTAHRSGPGRVDQRRPTAYYPELAGTAAVVTGAARGMGAVFSEGLALRGVDVIAADIDLDTMKRTAEEINAQTEALPEGGRRGRVVPAAVDVTDPAGHEELAALATAEFGRLDHWVNNAGIFPHAFAQDIPPEQIDAVLRVNVQGVLFGSQSAARHLRPGGAIVNMSSVSAVRVRKGRAAYCASKASVAHLTESLAVEFGDLGLRVNSIAPGYIDTEMTRWVQEDPAALKHALDSVPLHRLGSPQEVLGVLLFLLSDSARYVTGHSVAVDGGSRHV